MNNYYVCLLDCDGYIRGDIVVREDGVGPPGIPWAGFDPPAELKGTPALANVEDNGTGDLVFRYTIAGTETTFLLKARIGLPQAVAVIVPQAGAAVKDTAPPEKESEPVLKFGAGIVITSSRSYVGWNKGGARPAPRRKLEFDPMEYARADDPIDYLRRLM